MGWIWVDTANVIIFGVWCEALFNSAARTRVEPAFGCPKEGKRVEPQVEEIAGVNKNKANTPLSKYRAIPQGLVQVEALKGRTE